MRCEILTVDAKAPDAADIARAATVLRAGGLVAFPTETVYGLGANALDAAAVAKIFQAKGRPATNPLIVHVPDVAAARTLVKEWPAEADRLAARFWPGPLTLVLPRGPDIPDIVTAGGPTVAVRVPAHPVALAILRACGVPLAAPSANRSSRLSPTCAAHVLGDLGERIDLLVDGGRTWVGIESTVVDLTGQPPRLLRPGMIAVADLVAILGPVAYPGASASNPGPARSPGLMERHYAPRTPLELVVGCGFERARALRAEGRRVGWITLVEDRELVLSAVTVVRMPNDVIGYAALLYSTLHELDGGALDRIVLDLPPATDEWLAVHDRLRRAASR